MMSDVIVSVILLITTHPIFLLTSRVEDGRGGFRLSVAVGVSFAAPPQSDLP